MRHSAACVGAGSVAAVSIKRAAPVRRRDPVEALPAGLAAAWRWVSIGFDAWRRDVWLVLVWAIVGVCLVPLAVPAGIGWLARGVVRAGGPVPAARLAWGWVSGGWRRRLRVVV